MLETASVLGTSTVSDVFLLGIKGMFLVGILLYFIFSIIVVRQIHVMKRTIVTPFSPIVLMIGYSHLILVGLLGLTFLLIL